MDSYDMQRLEKYNAAKEVIKEHCQFLDCEFEGSCKDCPYPLSRVRCDDETEYLKQILAPDEASVLGQMDIGDYVEIPKTPTVYLAGKMTGLVNYKALFDIYTRVLSNTGYAVFNPATLPVGLEYEDYFPICFKMIDVAKHVVLMPNWVNSPGAKREKEYAESKGYKVTYLEGGVS